MDMACPCTRLEPRAGSPASFENPGFSQTGTLQGPGKCTGLHPVWAPTKRLPQVPRFLGPGAGAACGAMEVPHHPEPSSGLATLHPAGAEQPAALLHPQAELLCALLPDHRSSRGQLSSSSKLPLRDSPSFPFFPCPSGRSSPTQHAPILGS